MEDNAYALMKTDNDTVAILHSSATQWRHRFSLEIALERGSISLSGILSGSKSYGDETMHVSWAAEQEKGNPKDETRNYKDDPSWANEIAEFTDAILNDGLWSTGRQKTRFRPWNSFIKYTALMSPGVINGT